ncbi:hypothetical protein VMCG_08026 [Cytospora schulzeri]|uniref:Uncharacterized protein n=1 Tax=Cytospora schulzeri TaxID=448051 RepID=A0A423VY60_9PEZI|nr:hypothetical protein VMCG_08026 [Valsa malicola]
MSSETTAPAGVSSSVSPALGSISTDLAHVTAWLYNYHDHHDIAHNDDDNDDDKLSAHNDHNYDNDDDKRCADNDNDNDNDNDKRCADADNHNHNDKLSAHNDHNYNNDDDKRYADNDDNHNHERRTTDDDHHHHDDVAELKFIIRRNHEYRLERFGRPAFDKLQYRTEQRRYSLKQLRAHFHHQLVELDRQLPSRTFCELVQYPLQWLASSIQ